MQKMHVMASKVLSVNRKLTDLYMDDWDYFRIEGILRPIRPLPQDVPRDPPLAGLASSIAKAQEERLKKNLEELSYVLRSPADVALVTGSERLETVSLSTVQLLFKHVLTLTPVTSTAAVSTTSSASSNSRDRALARSLVIGILGPSHFITIHSFYV